MIVQVASEQSSSVGQPMIDHLSNLEKRLQRLETNELAIASRLDSNEQSFLEFLGQYKENRGQDLYSIADQSERLDYLSNLARNNCILLTGMLEY
jgi:hypothetical protein